MRKGGNDMGGGENGFVLVGGGEVIRVGATQSPYIYNTFYMTQAC